MCLLAICISSFVKCLFNVCPAFIEQALELVLCNKRSHCDEKPTHHNEE